MEYNTESSALRTQTANDWRRTAGDGVGGFGLSGGAACFAEEFKSVTEQTRWATAECRRQRVMPGDKIVPTELVSDQRCGACDRHATLMFYFATENAVNAGMTQG